jgi:DNA-binding NtrC family response regulator
MERTATSDSETFVEVTGGTLVALAARAGDAHGSPVPVGSRRCIVGRGDFCQVVLRDPQVSTSHCELIATDRGVRITDLGSRNGTFVNQVRLPEGGAVYLAADARLRCGQTSLDFHIVGQEQVPVSSAMTFGPLVGGSLPMRQLYAQLAAIAPRDLSVLITGETGTGKELVAKAVHDASRRRNGPFVIVDCTNIPASLAESALFGHEKGAFTGAISRHVSPFVAAKGGTIFFDELGELPLDVQPKLLRAIEARQIQAVGAHRYEPIDVRIVAATRRNLHAEMNARRFREDLFYRFAQVVLEVPPLRERTADLRDLVARFFAELDDPGALTRIEPLSFERLVRHDWPGNVRELRNVVMVAHASSDGGPIELGDFLGGKTGGVRLSDPPSAAQSYQVQKRELIERFDRAYFEALHRETGGNISAGSRRSGLSRARVREYLHRYGFRSTDGD